VRKGRDAAVELVRVFRLHVLANCRLSNLARLDVDGHSG
jgi:hypothetical protein